MLRKSRVYHLTLLLIFISFSFILFFYLRNITQDVYAGDIGDIATAAALFGIPHPPGYPTLTLLGFIFSKIPIPIPIISRIALVSVVAALGGLIIYFKFICDVLICHSRPGRESMDPRIPTSLKASSGRGKSEDDNVKRLGFDKLVIALLSTGILAFSYYYWLYAEVPEVFALNNLFIIAMYYTAWRFYHIRNTRHAELVSASTSKLQKIPNQVRDDRGLGWLYLTSLIVGLSMTNQQAVMFVFPGLFVMVLPDVWRMIVEKTNLSLRGVSQSGTTKQSRQILKQVQNDSIRSPRFARDDKKIKVFLRRGTYFIQIFKNVLIWFFIGLIPYIYVFISASTNPQINWMKAPTIYSFIRLMLRMDYRFGENLVGFTQRIVVQQVYFSTLITTFSLVLFIVGVMGMIYLFMKNKRIFSAFLTGFIFAGPLFIFIITPEIIDPDELGIVERMFMHSFVLFSFFIPFGFLAIQKISFKFLPRKIYGVIFLIPFFIVLLQMIYYNSPKTDLSKTKIGSNFAKDILSPLPEDSMVFLLGDLGTLNTWYMHYVEGFRRDIKLAGSYGDRNDYENEIYNEFKKKNKNSDLKIETVVVKQLPEILKTRKVYSMFQFPLGRKDYMWVPKGLVFELTPVSDIPEKDEYLKQVSSMVKQYHIAYRDKLLPSEQNNIAPYMSKQYANAFNHIGDFLYVRFNDLQSAYSYYSRAQIIDPQNPLTYAKLGIIQAEYPKQCYLAVENIDTSIEMYKIYRPYYTFALRIYKKCKVGEGKQNDLKTRYKNLFGKDLEKDPHY